MQYNPIMASPPYTPPSFPFSFPLLPDPCPFHCPSERSRHPREDNQTQQSKIQKDKAKALILRLDKATQ